MGVSLSNVDQDYSWQTWGVLLCLASKFGWDAAGAEPVDWVDNMQDPSFPKIEKIEKPSDAEIVDTYFWNFSYCVTPEDARNLGLALQRAKDATEYSINYSHDETTYARIHMHYIAHAQPLIDYCLKEDQCGFIIS